MSKWTPEPWGIIGTPGGWIGINSARDGLLFKLAYNNEDNAHRTVECVNGCGKAGIKDPVTTVPELVAVCTELIADYDKRNSASEFGDRGNADDLLYRVKAVLAKTAQPAASSADSAG